MTFTMEQRLASKFLSLLNANRHNWDIEPNKEYDDIMIEDVTKLLLQVYHDGVRDGLQMNERK